MRCVSKKFSVYESDSEPEITGMTFTEFLGADGQIRLFPLDVITFNKVDDLVRGKML